MLSRYGYLLIAAAMPLLAPAGEPSAPAVPEVKISKQETAESKSAISDKFCLRETGTRIRGQCIAGQVITREELERAGGTSLAEALPRLSPALRRSGH